MEKNTFQTFVEGIRPVWGPLNSEVVDLCRRQLEDLLKAPAAEEWLAALHREAPAGKELYRDPSHGFILWRTPSRQASTGHLTTTAGAGSSMACSRARWG